LVEAEGYILRITTEKWVNQVFSLAIYYTSLRRRWKPGQTIVFLHKTSVGDSIVGYGVIGRISEKDELPEEEQRECEKHGWKKAIEFKYVKPVKPLPIKETFIKDLGLSGRYLHGLKLDEEQVNSIISQAERLQR
jgi:hypothetical protein